MKKCFFHLAIVSIILIGAIPVGAQVPSMPGKHPPATITVPKATIGELSSQYFSGSWKKLQEKTSNLLSDIKDKIDAKNEFYFIIFLSQMEDQEPRLIRYLWHDPAPDPYVSRIPGRKTVHEIFLSDDIKWSLQSDYLSTEGKDPRLAQIPKFIKTIEPVILPRAKAPSTKTQPIFVTIRDVSLPFDRGTIKISDRITLSDEAQAVSIKSAAAELDFMLGYHNAYGNAFAIKLAHRLCKLIQALVPTTKEADFTERARKAIKACFRQYIEEFAPNAENQKLAMSIEMAFLAMLDEFKAESFEADFEFQNLPLNVWSFGLISARLSQNEFTRGRVKVTDAGVYSSELPKNPLTAAIVNFNPVPYDPESAKMKPAEMFRLFGGFVLTPEFGYCFGAGFSPLRGLSINAGWALIGIPIANNPEYLMIDGKEVKKPKNINNPLRIEWGGVFFFGLGYNFD